MGGFDVGLWKTIKRGWGNFNSRISLGLGNGRRVMLWKNKWFGNSTIRESFLSFYSMALKKDTWVADL